MTLTQWFLWLLGRFTPPTPPPPPGPADDVAQAMLQLVNNYRTRFGAPPLTLNAQLTAAAQGYATQEAAGGRPEAHGDYLGRIRAAGYRGAYVSENIAQGQTTPAGVVSDWALDEPHYRNMTDPVFKDVGFGHAGVYWVADFGAHN